LPVASHCRGERSKLSAWLIYGWINQPEWTASICLPSWPRATTRILNLIACSFIHTRCTVQSATTTQLLYTRHRSVLKRWYFKQQFQNIQFSYVPHTEQPPAHAVSSLVDFSTLKIEAIYSSETSVHTRSTRRHIPEDGILHSHRRENLKPYTL
jgi:hypothetical protein